MHVILFFFRMQHSIKLYHWMTMSHARHVAADKLYDELLDLVDDFVETFIGRYGRPKFTKKELTVEVVGADDTGIVKFLDECAGFLTKDLGKFVGKDDSDLWNIRDEILGKINQTKYLFTLQ